MSSSGAVPLPASTDRLVFRTWSAEDWPLALALWGDPRVTALIGGPFSEAKVRERLQMEIAQQRQHGVQYWVIFFKQRGEHAGCCGLRPYDPSRGMFELGFRLAADHWGKGLATEAARSTVEHAFETLGALALFAGHHPRNLGSKRVLEKLRFRYTHDQLYPPTGLQHPSYLLTLDEYRRSRTSDRLDPTRG
jgi:ribosomal-protein-alanine N-acetyltransferase